MYETITEEFILSTISGYRQETTLIEGKIQAIRASLADDTDLIRAVSLPSSCPDNPGSGNPSLKDLGDVYEKYLALAKSQRQDCIAYVLQLTEKKDAMDRVMAAFGNLPEREHEVLAVFSRKRRTCKTERATWETMHALYLSERTVQRIRKQAVNKIRDLYASDRTLLDLQMEAIDRQVRQNWETETAVI